MCNLGRLTMQQVPTQKFGYLDIKQSSKVRPRKLKSWRRRWVVLTKLSNLSSDEYVAKLDLYDTETKWRNNSSDKMTLVLENISCIQNTSSRTHQHAFEVIEKQPVLVMCGATELESYSWILTFQQIFTPELIEVTKGRYRVTVLANEHSSKWNLSGEFTLSVSPFCISLEDQDETCVVKWELNTLLRFSLEKNLITGKMDVLVIECGQSSPTGQSCFNFQSDEAQDLLVAIRRSICLALAQKQHARTEVYSRQRKISVTVSEKNIQNLLDKQPVDQSFLRHKSNTGSSTSAANNASLTVNRELSSAAGSSVTNSFVSVDGGLLLKIEENMPESQGLLNARDSQAHEVLPKVKASDQSCVRSSSYPIEFSKDTTGYCKLIDVTADGCKVFRRNSSTWKQSSNNFDGLRSAWTEIVTLQSNSEVKPGRSVSFGNDNEEKSDKDSAISSLSLSSASEEFFWREIFHCQDTNLTEGSDVDFYDRNKSNSTPDLQAYLIKQKEEANLENDYEELDELRALFLLDKENEASDKPPALPARPSLMSSNSIPDQRSKMDVKKKKPFFKKHRKCISETKDTDLCICESVRGEKSHSSINCPHYVPKKGDWLFQRSKSHIAKTSSREELLGSSCSSITDITEMKRPQLAKRRSSSDITPVASYLCFDPDTKEANINKTCSLPMYGQNPQGSSRCRLEVSDTKNNFEVKSTILKSVPRPVKNNYSNPLISFFLDDANFKSNPMVTGEMASFPTSVSSNVDNLAKGESIQCNANEVNLTSLAFQDEHVKENSSDFIITNNISRFNIWNDDVANTKYINATSGFIKYPSFSAPINNDPFLWNRNSIYTIPPTSLQETTRFLQETDSDYIAMKMKTSSSQSKKAISMKETKDRVSVIARDSKPVMAKDEEIYIPPTGLTSMGFNHK